MMYGLAGGAKILAIPGGTATCPRCGAALTAKCGEINAWHWSHAAGDCDPWWEPESDWHRNWKAYVRPDNVEVTRGPHRADIVGAGGGVIELQHSSISPAEIAERESFYGKMIWIFNGWPFMGRFSAHSQEEGDFWFLWKRPRETIATVKAPLFIDLDGASLFRSRFTLFGKDHPSLAIGAGFTRSRHPEHFLLEITEREEGGYTGRGKLWTQAGFLRHFLGGVLDVSPGAAEAGPVSKAWIDAEVAR